ncbi:MAG: hypothetical protein KC636_13405, partial [Myxococcales bacterium]|nr:hypothetical protein [Myxococcales bacterium]
SLRGLSVRNNLISDLTPIAAPAWTDLDCFALDLRDNPLNAEAVDVIIPSLCAKGAWVSWTEDEPCNPQCAPIP